MALVLTDLCFRFDRRRRSAKPFRSRASQSRMQTLTTTNQTTCQNLHPKKKNELNKLLSKIDRLGGQPVTVRAVFQINTSPSEYRCIIAEFKKNNYRTTASTQHYKINFEN